jgi:hypothetical protein
MQKSWAIGLGVMAIALSSCSIEKLYSLRYKHKKQEFEQLDFHDLVQRYIYKEESTNSIEGIYAVSVVVLRRVNHFWLLPKKKKL